jgi:formylmethanofuran dehydrogenase subunit B
MTREYVELAMKEGYPFEIKMADGRSYRVPDEYSIALLKSTAVIVVENGLPHILPLLTVTGISYLERPSSNGQQ